MWMMCAWVRERSRAVQEVRAFKKTATVGGVPRCSETKTGAVREVAIHVPKKYIIHKRVINDAVVCSFLSLLFFFFTLDANDCWFLLSRFPRLQFSPFLFFLNIGVAFSFFTS